MIQCAQWIIFSVQKIRNNIISYNTYILTTCDIKITEMKQYIQK